MEERIDRDEMDDLKPRRRRDEGRDDDDQPRRKRRAAPEIVSFTVMFNFGSYYATAEYKAPEGFTPDDIDDFIADLKSDGYKVFKPRTKDDRGGNRGGRGNYEGGRNYDSRRNYRD